MKQRDGKHMDVQQRPTDIRERIADFLSVISILLFMLIGILFLIAAGGEPTMFSTSTIFGISPSNAMTYVSPLGSALLLTSLGFFLLR